MQDRLGIGRLASSGLAGARGKVTGGGAASSAVDWMELALGAIAMPGAPVEEPWSLSLAGLIGSNREVPPVALKALRLLDGFGSVRVSASSVGFDATDVDWVDVTQLRTASLFDLVTEVAVEREVERLRKLLPPVPGRKWVLTRALEILQSLIQRGVRQDEAARDSKDIVATIAYRGRFGRERELRPGVLGAAILAALPKVNASLLATAAAHDVPVRPIAERRHFDRAFRQRNAELLSIKLDEMQEVEST